MPTSSSIGNVSPKSKEKIDNIVFPQNSNPMRLTDVVEEYDEAALIENDSFLEE
jgi:hypothetical protein